MGFWEFCNANPWLAAFGLIVGAFIVSEVSGDIRIAIRGYIPYRPSPGRAEEDEE